MRKLLLLASILFLSACVSFPEAPVAMVEPAVNSDSVTSIDGAELGLTVWEAENQRAVILALHGMNDYSNAFALPGAWWAENAAITTYALDQRGFGRSPAFGQWAGEATMKADLRAALSAIRARHPNLPVYVLGHSMGAAVVMAADADAPLGADGLILAAPAVWGGPDLPILYRVSLNIAATFAPGKTLTGERTERQSTDNIDILRAMFADPLVIKETRLDAIVGVTNVMDTANRAPRNLQTETLVLIGAKDEIIPIDAMEKAARDMPNARVIRYPEGWHLLFRDLQGETVWRDVAAWIAAREGRT